MPRQNTDACSTAATKTMTPTLSASIIAGSPGGGRRLLHQHEHRVERGEVDERVDLDPLVDVGVELADARDEADRDSARVDRRQATGSPAGRDDDVAGLDDVLFPHALEDECFAAGDTVADDARGIRLQVEGGDGAGLVGEQCHAGAAPRHARHAADEAGGGDDGVVDMHAGVRASGDQYLLLELAGRAADDASRDAVVVAGERRPLPEAEQPAELGVLKHGCLALDELLPQALDLGAQLLVLRFSAENVSRPADGILERLRRALRRHLEGVDDGRAGVLHAVQGPARRLAEVAR